MSPVSDHCRISAHDSGALDVCSHVKVVQEAKQKGRGGGGGWGDTEQSFMKHSVMDPVRCPCIRWSLTSRL